MGKRKPRHDPEFAKRLDEAIEATGRMAKDIADELGVDPTLLSKWRRGHQVPEGAMVLRLPTILGCDGHWLTTGESRQGDAERKLAAIRGILDGELPPPNPGGTDAPPGDSPNVEGTHRSDDPDRKDEEGAA